MLLLPKWCNDTKVTRLLFFELLGVVSLALQMNLAKIGNARNHIYSENFKLKLCTCAQSKALGTHTKFQLEIRIRSAISAIHKFREDILDSSQNVSKTTPRRLATLWNARLLRTAQPYQHGNVVRRIIQLSSIRWTPIRLSTG